VSFKLLDPTLDIVFKLLLLRDQALLRDMIEAVLNLPAPLQELKVLNPEIPKDFPADKAIVLDIRARLHDGRQVDLEMQSTFPPGTRARFLYYWAKAFASTIGRGEVYTALRPCISILWFKDPVLDIPQGERTIRQVGLCPRCRFVPTLWDLVQALAR
jgi:predicted transposase/invertase (TIGR01784 family)